MTLKKISMVIVFLINILFGVRRNRKIKIGIFGCRHDINIGNYLIKFAMNVKLKELGYEPYIIATNEKNVNISFINRTTNMVLIKNYSSISENEYNILLVNSDQTWRKWDEYVYDYGFLHFAKDWNTLKFVYGASLGFDYWNFNKTDEDIILPLIKSFSETSVREKGSIELIKKHFGIIPELVLDPTLIINKKYYLDLIKDYSPKNNEIFSDNINYIFVYYVYRLEIDMQSFAQNAGNNLNYKIYFYKLNNDSLVEDFIYFIKNSKAVVTNSFHCTIFSILFQKPFISFNYNYTGIERLKSLSELLGFQNRIAYVNKTPSLNLLKIPPRINYKTFLQKKRDSIDYIKRNLNLYKK